MIVLVHGAYHDKRCWEPLQTALRAKGVDSVALDLPGHGADPTPLGDLTLDRYVDALLAAVDEIDEPVVLVGHSQAGVTISQAAERAPGKISALVYLTAALVDDGQSIIDVLASDPDGELAANVVISDDFTAMSIDPAAAAGLFYADCEAATAERAASQLCPEPLAVAATPLRLSAERWGSIPRSYILCTQDRAISPTAQRAMVAAVGVDQVVELTSSHSPFLSMPDELAAVLLDLTP
jgi:pimeloyl-ACP methyl ester carboxylesterase